MKNFFLYCNIASNIQKITYHTRSIELDLKKSGYQRMHNEQLIDEEIVYSNITHHTKSHLKLHANTKWLL